MTLQIALIYWFVTGILTFLIANSSQVSLAKLNNSSSYERNAVSLAFTLFFGGTLLPIAVAVIFGVGVANKIGLLRRNDIAKIFGKISK